MTTSYKSVFIWNFITMISCCLAGVVHAAEYYVSPNGNTSWPNCTNIDTPCSTQTAFNNAQAGDVVSFRGGTYYVPAKNFSDTYHGYYEPTHSGVEGNPIIFQAFPGETPLFSGTAGGSGDGGHAFATILGVYRKSYIIFDGFSFQANNGSAMARVIIYSDDPNNYDPATVQLAHHITIRNCIFNGGSTSTSSTDNEEGLRVEDATDVTVRNTRFYNYRQIDNWHNTGAIKFYHVARITVENNEIHDCSSGIYDKSGSNGNVFRYNYIYNCHNAIYSPSNGYSNINGSVYHNLVRNCTGSDIEITADDGDGLNVNGWQIYNNTIYQSSPVSGNPVTVKYGTDIKFYNNILVGYGVDYGGAQIRFASSTIGEMDYNQYGATNFMVRSEGIPYSNLSSWQQTGTLIGGGNPDMNSFTSDPLFVNASGNMNVISDFHFQGSSPCIGSGKNSSNRGADISLVGIQNDSQPDPTPPQPPGGLSAR